ncbi:MAG: hypothetical protein AB2L12_15030 [Smithellaceae bacterium]
MNLATRAALYNALLFPGWGHFCLKRYKRGLMFILPVLAGMLSICWIVVQVAFNILKTTPIKKGTVDISTVIQLSLNSTKAIYEQGVATPCSILLVLLFMILLWIISIIDAYKLGKKQMQESHIPE